MCVKYAERDPDVDQIPKEPYKFDDKSRKIFMAALAETGRIYHAAESAGVSVSMIYQRRKIDDELANEMEAAMGQYRDSLEEEMHRRAVEGVIEAKYHQGLPVIDYELDEHGQVVTNSEGKPKAKGQAFVRKYSDTLLLAHTRRHIPEYNEKRQVDLKVTGLEGLLEEIKPSTGLPSQEDDFDSDSEKRVH